MKLFWAKRRGDDWYRLNSLILSNVSDKGVYVICYDDDIDGEYVCVYVGQGSIRKRLEFHQTNPDVQFYADFGTLYVTWAKVPPQKRDGVESFLADELEPLEGERHPDVHPIKVNLPFRHTE